VVPDSGPSERASHIYAADRARLSKKKEETSPPWRGLRENGNTISKKESTGKRHRRKDEFRIGLASLPSPRSGGLKTIRYAVEWEESSYISEKKKLGRIIYIMIKG